MEGEEERFIFVIVPVLLLPDKSFVVPTVADVQLVSCPLKDQLPTKPPCGPAKVFGVLMMVEPGVFEVNGQSAGQVAWVSEPLQVPSPQEAAAVVYPVK